MSWKIGKKCTLSQVSGPLTKGELSSKGKEYKINYYDGDKSGYEEFTHEIRLYKDGSLGISKENSEQFIFFYPEEVEHLRTILKRGPGRKGAVK